MPFIGFKIPIILKICYPDIEKSNSMSVRSVIQSVSKHCYKIQDT